MAFCETLIGKYVDLVTANVGDAKFTLDIRNNPNLTRFIPIIQGTIENQKNWISKQIDKPFDVFFVIKKHNNQECIGTLSFYDYEQENNSCEIGRYISHGNAFENIEAVLLLLDKLFITDGLSRIMLNIHEDNQPVISLWTRFGAVFNSKEDMGNWYSAQYFLYKEAYLEYRGTVAKLLRY